MSNILNYGIYSMQGGNYFGSGSDGSVTISSNTNLTSTQDSDMIVKNYSSLTINSTYTLTTSIRCKGLLIYVKGDCTINGTLTMTDRGGYVDATSAGVSSTGLRIAMLKSGGTDTLSAADFAGCGTAATTAVANHPDVDGDGKIYTVARAGGGGGQTHAATGGAGSTGSTGGGGAGSMSLTSNGKGAAATCFSGGAGGGACTQGNVISDGTANGGPGGDGDNDATESQKGRGVGGGAGNNGGSGWNNTTDEPGSWSDPGANGTGGIIWLIIGGNLTIGSSGLISSNGAGGGDASSWGGGGSGGGSIHVLYGGTLSNTGSITTTGGAPGAGGASNGGYGGAGSYILEQVDE